MKWTELNSDQQMTIGDKWQPEPPDWDDVAYAAEMIDRHGLNSQQAQAALAKIGKAAVESFERHVEASTRLLEQMRGERRPCGVSDARFRELMQQMEEA